jgi:hypothetical protein
LKSWTALGPLNYGTFKVLGLSSVEILELLFNILLLLMIDGLLAARSAVLQGVHENKYLSTLCSVLLFYNIVLTGAFGSYDFIYFQF